MSTEPGIKRDAGKSPWDLLPWGALGQVVDVLEYGARKYAPHGWRLVPDAERRYLAALMRHAAAYGRGEPVDPESGLSHLAHLATNALFLAELAENK